MFSLLAFSFCEGQYGVLIYVKGVGWLHGLDEWGILDKDWSWKIVGLNFEFLLVLNHDDATWDCPKMGVLGKKNSLLNTQFWESKNSSRYFVVKNHKFSLWKVVSTTTRLPYN
jgi:hypothetical protein